MQRAFRSRLLAALLAATPLLPSCTESNGGGSGGPDPTLTFSITDAASDDLQSFTVEVTQMRLEQLGGGFVDVLTTPATVDLATLSETSQILSIGNVPVATYVGAEITLDFSASTALLVGQTTQATILDVAGNPLTGPLTVPIDFGTNRLVMPIRRHKLLEFDFDLNQSVTTDIGSNTVTVEPAFAMHIDPTDPKPLLAVGTLVSVNAPESTFVMDVKTLDGTLLTTATFRSDDETIWQIDGVSSTGDAGLAALATAGPGTWVQLAGFHALLEPIIDVVFVEAGVGTWNGGTDIVEGHIVDRVGAAGTDPILTVLGHSSDASHTTLQFNTTFTVTTSFLNTKVLRTAVDQVFDSDDLVIGQRVRIFGSLSGVTMDATSATSVVKLRPTRVLGFALGAPASGVQTMDIVRVDLVDEGLFNWPGGGPTPPNPDLFTIQVGGLGGSLGIGAGTPIEARGFFPPEDDAAEDFVASSLTNRSLAPSLMLVRNRPAGMNVTATTIAGVVTLLLNGTPTTGEVAIVDPGFVGSQPLPFSPNPTIVASINGPRWYVLWDKSTGEVDLFLTFPGFAAAVDNLAGQGTVISQVSAVGVYSAAQNRIAAQIATVIVE